MRLAIFSSLLLAARLASATPATVVSGSCGVFDRSGACVCDGRFVVAQPFWPGALIGQGPWHFHCEGDLGWRPGSMFRDDSTCFVQVDDVTTVPGRLMLLINPAGHVMLDCFVQLGG